MRLKNEDIFHMIGEADGIFVDEANPERGKSNRTKRIAGITTLAACLLAAVICASMYLFTPLNSEAVKGKYSNLPYGAVIEKIEQTKSTSQYTTRFGEIIGELQGLNNKKNTADFMTEAPQATEGEPGNSTSSSSTYVETTDNQVRGVIEGDLIKRSDSCFFYLNCNIYGRCALEVYAVPSADTPVGTIHTPIAIYSLNENISAYTHPHIYLSEDCRTLFILYYNDTCSVDKIVTNVLALNVSDVNNITEKLTLSVDGILDTSRLTEQGMLVFTSSTCLFNKCDYNKPETFIPGITVDGQTTILGEDDILVSDNCIGNTKYITYSIMTLISPNGDMVVDSKGILGSCKYLVTEGSIYAVELHPGKPVKSQIAAYTFTADGIESRGACFVEGTVHNQYSMDEYNGMLRVVTTVSNPTNSSLYVLDSKTLETKATLLRFGVDGEEVRSVRFDGDIAYVCTAEVVRFTDPVFVIDMTDLRNIKAKDTGKIAGYSESLVNLRGGYLLGIGVGDAEDILKIEIYKPTDTDVVCVSSIQLLNLGFDAQDSKSHFINRDRGLVGLQVCDFSATDSSNRSKYLLFEFDYETEQVTQVLCVNNEAHYICARAVLVDDYFCIFGADGMQVRLLNNNNQKG